MVSHNDPIPSRPSMFDDLIRAKARDRTRRRQLAIALVPIAFAVAALIVVVAIKFAHDNRSKRNSQVTASESGKTTTEPSDLQAMNSSRSEREKSASGNLTESKAFARPEASAARNADSRNKENTRDDTKHESAADIFRPGIERVGDAKPNGDDVASIPDPIVRHAPEPDAPSPRQPLRRSQDASKPEPAKQEQQRESLYEGKPASYWIKVLRDAPTDRDASNIAEHAIRALEAIGPAAKEHVPDLVPLLKCRVNKKLAGVVRDALVRSGAAKALAAIGPDAKAAVQPLIAATEDDVDYVRMDAVRALGKVCASEVPDGVAGPNPKETASAVRGLAKAVGNNDWQMRKVAAEALSLIGPPAKDALPSLTAALKDTDTLPIVKAFASIGEPAVPYLITAMQDRSSEVREKAVLALAAIGSESDEAIQALTKARKDENASVRSTAEAALERIQPSHKKEKGPQARDAQSRFQGKTAEQWVSELERTSDSYVAGQATRALLEIGPEAKNVTPNLVKLLENRHAKTFIHANAALALGAIGPKAKSAIPSLINAIQNSKEWEVRRHAARALGRICISPRGLYVFRDISQEGNVSDGIVGDGLTLSRPTLGPNPDAMRELLELHLLSLNDFEIYPLGPLAGTDGPDQKVIEANVVPALLKLLQKDPDRIVCEEAAVALGRIGPAAHVATQPLYESMVSRRTFSADDALAGLGDAAVPVLIMALQDKDDDVRADAALALGRTGSNAKEVADSLRKATHDSVPAVRSAAAKALQRLPSR